MQPSGQILLQNLIGVRPGAVTGVINGVRIRGEALADGADERVRLVRPRAGAGEVEAGEHGVRRAPGDLRGAVQNVHDPPVGAAGEQHEQPVFRKEQVLLMPEVVRMPRLAEGGEGAGKQRRPRLVGEKRQPRRKLLQRLREAQPRSEARSEDRRDADVLLAAVRTQRAMGLQRASIPPEWS